MNITIQTQAAYDSTGLRIPCTSQLYTATVSHHIPPRSGSHPPQPRNQYLQMVERVKPHVNMSPNPIPVQRRKASADTVGGAHHKNSKFGIGSKQCPKPELRLQANLLLLSCHFPERLQINLTMGRSRQILVRLSSQGTEISKKAREEGNPRKRLLLGDLTVVWTKPSKRYGGETIGSLHPTPNPGDAYVCVNGCMHMHMQRCWVAYASHLAKYIEDLLILPSSSLDPRV